MQVGKEGLARAPHGAFDDLGLLFTLTLISALAKTSAAEAKMSALAAR
jgi:hypothetical protein